MLHFVGQRSIEYIMLYASCDSYFYSSSCPVIVRIQLDISLSILLHLMLEGLS